MRGAGLACRSLKPSVLRCRSEPRDRSALRMGILVTG